MYVCMYEKLDYPTVFYSEYLTEYQSKLSTDHSSGERWYEVVEVHFTSLRWWEIASKQTSVTTLHVSVVWAFLQK